MLASGDSYSLQKLNNIISNDFPLDEASDSLLIKTLAIALKESLEETTKLREDIDAFQTRFLINDNENHKLFKSLSAEHDNLAKKVHQIDREQLDTQQYIRRWTVEIKGIPESIEQRDLKSYVIKQILERACGYKLYPRDIEACHRLWNRNPREPARVVARFVNREDAENAIRGRYKLQSYGHLKKIFIIDNLCPRYREIFDDLSELKQAGIINQVWSYNGKIHFKSTNNRRAKGKRVFHMDDIEPLKASARLFELEREARDEYEAISTNRHQSTCTPSPDIQHLHTSSSHREPVIQATIVPPVIPSQAPDVSSSCPVAAASAQVDSALLQVPSAFPVLPPAACKYSTAEVEDVSDFSDDNSLANIPDLEKSEDVPDTYPKPSSPELIVSTVTQVTKCDDASSPQPLLSESNPDHSPSQDCVVVNNDVTNVIERPSPAVEQIAIQIDPPSSQKSVERDEFSRMKNTTSTNTTQQHQQQPQIQPSIIGNEPVDSATGNPLTTVVPSYEVKSDALDDQICTIDDPPTDSPPIDVVSVSSFVSEDDVFNESGDPAPNQSHLRPISEEDHDRFYSCSASIDGIQLKLKRQTVAFLNEFCHSLDPSSSSKSPSDKSQSITHDQLASFSESHLTHAGFFNSNDSVPEVNVKLSRCNSYASLLTENDSNG